MRGLAYNRKKSFIKAKRKQNLCRKFYGFEYYNNLHQYSKNKIHCSCPLCRAKTGKHKMAWGGGGGRMNGKNWKISDLRKINQMEWDSQNWYDEDNFIIPREDTYEDWWYWWLNDKLENLIVSTEEGIENEIECYGSKY